MPNPKTPTAEEIFQRLAEPVDDSFISSMPKGRGDNKQTVEYITWSRAADLLDQRAPGWTCDIAEVGERAGKTFIRLGITICGDRRENIGHENSETDSYGDPFSNAYAQAFKRTAVLFMPSLRARLYSKEHKSRDHSNLQSGNVEKPKNPIAQNQGELRTPKQESAIRSIAHQQRINPENECQALFGCSPDQLTRKAASYFIDYLKAGKFLTPLNAEATQKWNCAEQKRKKALELRAKLRENLGVTDQELDEDVIANFPVGDITQFDDDEMSRYIAHLVKHLNRGTVPQVKRSA
jgi:hypothetical protein